MENFTEQRNKYLKQPEMRSRPLCHCQSWTFLGRNNCATCQRKIGCINVLGELRPINLPGIKCRNPFLVGSSVVVLLVVTLLCMKGLYEGFQCTGLETIYSALHLTLFRAGPSAVSKVRGAHCASPCFLRGLGGCGFKF